MDEEEGTGAGRSTLTGARAQKFYSTRDTAKCRWPPAYVTFRHDVADRLGTAGENPCPSWFILRIREEGTRLM